MRRRRSIVHHDDQRLIKHHMSSHVTSCHVKSSARTWNMVCVSRSRSQEEYAGNHGASTRLSLTNTQTPMWGPNAVANRTGRPLTESNELGIDRSIDRSLSVRQTIFESRHRSRIKTLHVEEEEPSFDNRQEQTSVEQVRTFIHSEWHRNRNSPPRPT